MKILAFSNCALDPLLGSGRTRLAWSAGLRALGHEVETVDSAQLLAGTNEHAPGRRFRLGWECHRNLAARDLADVDLIEFYGAEFWFPTWRLAARRGRRPFLAAHSDGLELLAAERLAPPRALSLRGLAAAGMRRGETLAFSRCDGLVMGCEADRRFLLERKIGDPARIAVIPLGLEPAFHGLPLDLEREERVAFLGTWIERKGIKCLVAAMIPLLEARPTLVLDLLGVGTDAETVREAFPPGLHARIEISPRLSVAEVVGRLKRAQVYFFPSEYEGFGLGLAEAMACGCAAVTTPTGFGADLAHDAEALICPFGDVSAMQSAVASLLDDEPLRRRIAATGWERVQALRWETSIRRLADTYQGWIGKEG